MKFPRSYWQKNPSDCCLRWYIRVIILILKIFSYENFKVKVTQKFFPFDLSLFLERTKIKGRNIRMLPYYQTFPLIKNMGRRYCLMWKIIFCFRITLCGFRIMLCGFRIMLCGFRIMLCGFRIMLCGFGILTKIT